MKHILFVDDEPNVLEGLRSMLRRHRREWDMQFACGAQAALAQLAQTHYDVIISDMRMPGMDGAALLKIVQERYPHIVRIVLSGQTDEDAARRVVHVAHQFMAKPCEPNVLQETIERACRLQLLLADDRLRETVGQIGQLPMKPRTYARLIETLESPRASLSDAAAVVAQDIATSAKVLQVVNSAFFGLARRITDVESAVSYLGLEVVKALTLSIEMRDSLGHAGVCPGLSLETLQAHGLLTAQIARKLVPDRVRAQEAFAAAMFHNVGLLVLMCRMPEAVRRLVALAQQGRDLPGAELEVLGVTHAEIGAYLLGIWGLPAAVVEAVALHQSPGRTEQTAFGVAGAVHVASALAGELCGAAAGELPVAAGLDLAYLKAVGVTERLADWRETARSAASPRS